jgi:hypothetical protein
LFQNKSINLGDQKYIVRKYSKISSRIVRKPVDPISALVLVNEDEEKEVSNA